MIQQISEVKKVTKINTCMDCRYSRTTTHSKDNPEEPDQEVSEVSCSKHRWPLGDEFDAAGYTCNDNTADRDVKIKKMVEFRDVLEFVIHTYSAGSSNKERGKTR